MQYACNFCWTDLYVNVCRGVFRTQMNIYVGASLKRIAYFFVVL